MSALIATLIGFQTFSGQTTWQERAKPKGDFEALTKVLSYPQKAILAGLGGKVSVQVFIDSTGEVSGVEIVESPDSLLSQAAVRAVKAIECEPPKRNGAPVADSVAVPFIFLVPEDGPRRKVADRTFVKRSYCWVETTYRGQPFPTLKTNSKKWTDLVRRDPTVSLIRERVGLPLVVEPPGQVVQSARRKVDRITPSIANDLQNCYLLAPPEDFLGLVDKFIFQGCEPDRWKEPTNGKRILGS